MTELTPAPLQLDCIRCGHKMPALSDDERRLFLSVGGSAVAQHPIGQCPPEQQKAAALQEAATAGGVDLGQPRTRVFEAKLTLTELKGDLTAQGATAERELITDFVATVEGTTAAAVMAPGGPLASRLGEKWMEVAEHISLADVPAVPGAPAPSL